MIITDYKIHYLIQSCKQYKTKSLHIRSSTWYPLLVVPCKSELILGDNEPPLGASQTLLHVHLHMLTGVYSGKRHQYASS